MANWRNPPSVCRTGTGGFDIPPAPPQNNSKAAPREPGPKPPYGCQTETGASRHGLPPPKKNSRAGPGGAAPSAGGQEIDFAGCRDGDHLGRIGEIVDPGEQFVELAGRRDPEQ